MGDRWFDDIVDNNARREGYHPLDNYFEESLDMKSDEEVYTPEEMEEYGIDEEGNSILRFWINN